MFVFRKYTDKRTPFATDLPLNSQMMNKKNVCAVLDVSVFAERERDWINEYKANGTKCQQLVILATLVPCIIFTTFF